MLILIISFLKKNQKEIKFLLLFIFLFLSGNIIFILSIPQLKPILVDKITVYPTLKLINLITPDEKIHIENSGVITGSVSMSILSGCEGTQGVLILTSALLAFPMKIKEKIFGILLGTCFIYIFNLTRLVSLYYILKYNPYFFDLTHTYVGQISLIFIGVIFFVLWVEKARIKEKK